MYNNWSDGPPPCWSSFLNSLEKNSGLPHKGWWHVSKDNQTHRDALISMQAKPTTTVKKEKKKKSTVDSIKSYKWVYKACFTSWKNRECYVTERADNALSHRLLLPWGDMGTDDFVFTRKGIQIRRVFGGWSPSVEESNYLLHSWEAACLSQSQVSLGDPGWARLRKTL